MKFLSSKDIVILENQPYSGRKARRNFEKMKDLNLIEEIIHPQSNKKTITNSSWIVWKRLKNNPYRNIPFDLLPKKTFDSLDFALHACPDEIIDYDSLTETKIEEIPIIDPSQVFTFKKKDRKIKVPYLTSSDLFKITTYLSDRYQIFMSLKRKVRNSFLGEQDFKRTVGWVLRQKLTPINILQLIRFGREIIPFTIWVIEIPDGRRFYSYHYFFDLVEDLKCFSAGTELKIHLTTGYPDLIEKYIMEFFEKNLNLYRSC